MPPAPAGGSTKPVLYAMADISGHLSRKMAAAMVALTQVLGELDVEALFFLFEQQMLCRVWLNKGVSYSISLTKFSILNSNSSVAFV